MNWLYLSLIIGASAIPILYSFHPKMRLVEQWPAIFSAITITAIIFILWDYSFTKNQIWGFNENYHLPFIILGMPVEEWLFFWLIPYPSLFIHYSIQYFKPSWILPPLVTKSITWILLLGITTLLLGNLDRTYTVINFSLAITLLIYGIILDYESLSRFWISYLIVLIPFVVVNGVLTGVATPEPIVWYNNNENLRVRFLTIPIEDFIYTFNMLYLSLLLIPKFRVLYKSRELRIKTPQ